MTTPSAGLPKPLLVVLTLIIVVDPQLVWAGGPRSERERERERKIVSLAVEVVVTRWLRTATT